jgi:hypothetical protein
VEWLRRLLEFLDPRERSGNGEPPPDWGWPVDLPAASSQVQAAIARGRDLERRAEDVEPSDPALSTTVDQWVDETSASLAAAINDGPARSFRRASAGATTGLRARNGVKELERIRSILESGKRPQPDDARDR